MEDNKEDSTLPEPQRRDNTFSGLGVDGLTIDDPTEEHTRQEHVPADNAGAAAVQPGPATTLLSSSSPAASQTNREYTVEAPADEWLVAAHCMLTDMHSLEDYVAKLCNDFLQGKIDASVLAMSHNTAVDLAGQAEAKFLESCPQFEGTLGYLDMMENNARKEKGKKPKMEGLLDLGDQAGKFVYNVARYIMENLHATWLTKESQRIRVEGPDADCQEAHKDVGHLHDVWRETIIMRRFWRIYDPNSVLMPVLDKFSSIVPEIAKEAQYKRTGHVPLHAVFAAQIMINMHRILCDGQTRGLQELRMAANRHKITLNTHLQFANSVYADRMVPGSDEAMQDILEWIQICVFEDNVVFEWQEGDGMNDNKKAASAEDEWQPSKLLAIHPWLCGALRFNLDHRVHDLGLEHWNYYGYVRSWTHIYNALLQEGYVAEKWMDMEKILDMHPSTDFFSGSVPDKRDSYGKQFDLAQGLSSTNFAKNRKATNLALKKSSKFGDSAPICRLHFEHAKLRHKELAVRSPLLEATLSETPRNSPSSLRKNSEVLRRQWKERKPLTPTQLLEFTKLSFMEERDAHRFGYLALQQQCHEFGRKLLEEVYAINEKLEYVEREGFEDDKVDEGIQFTTWFILSSFAEHVEKTHLPIVGAALKILTTMISSHGYDQCNKVQDSYRLEQHLAKQAVPATPAPTQQPPKGITGQKKKLSTPVAHPKETPGEEKKTSTPVAHPKESAQKKMAKGLADLY